MRTRVGLAGGGKAIVRMVAIVIAGVVAVSLAIAPNAWANTITVTTTADNAGGGDCASTDTNCSLREALSAAVNGDTVSVPPGTYMLSANPGVLSVGANITISGAGARTTTIQQTANNVAAFQVGMVTATISGMEITSTGMDTFGGAGGGIANFGNLTLDNVAVDGISMSAGIAGESVGAGIYNGGTMTIMNSTIANNTITSGSGSGQLARGAGIYSGNGTSLTISNSTISGNTAASGGQLAQGGGIFTQSSMTLSSVTLASNSAHDGGGNLYADDTSQTSAIAIAMHNSIIAGGSSTNGNGNCTFVTAPDGAALGPEDYNLEDQNQCGLTGAWDLPNHSPMLGTLQNNGGPTDTMALPQSSPAVDADGLSANCPATDQRGNNRTVPCDMGAFEGSYPPAEMAAPSITGTAAIGHVLTCQHGTWGGVTPTFTYQWLRNGANITGATKANYTVASADGGKKLSCRVTATNADGHASATSSSVAIPAAPKPSKPSVTKTISVSKRKATFKFTAAHATRFQCSLRKTTTSNPNPKPQFSACSSPKTYTSLAKASYEFEVRGVNSSGTGPAAVVRFTI